MLSGPFGSGDRPTNRHSRTRCQTDKLTHRDYEYMKRDIRIFAALIACVGLAPFACTPSEPDYHGVRSVDSPGATWTLAPAPDWEAGNEDGPEALTLHRVTSGLILGEYAAVVDGSTLEIHILDAQGRQVRAIGRRGSGPGEFLSIDGVSRAALDRLAVWDRGLDRLTVMDIEGQLVAEGRTGLAGDGLETFAFVGVLASGDFVFTSTASPRSLISAPPGERRDPVRLLRGNPLKSPPVGWEEVDIVRGKETWKWDAEWAGGVLTGNPPVIFGAETFVAVSDSSLVVAFSDSMEVRRYHEGRPPPSKWRLTAERTPATRADLAQVRESLATDLDAAARRDQGVVLNGTPLPEIRRHADEESILRRPYRAHWPPMAGMLGDDEGRTWISAGGPPQNGLRLWTVLNATGSAEALIRFPDEYTILDIADDAILGVRMDSLGVETVVRWSWMVER